MTTDDIPMGFGDLTNLEKIAEKARKKDVNHISNIGKV